MNRWFALPITLLALTSLASAQEAEPEKEQEETEQQQEESVTPFEQELAPIIPM